MATVDEKLLFDVNLRPNILTKFKKPSLPSNIVFAAHDSQFTQTGNKPELRICKSI